MLDLTTTEVCDFLFGGVLACTEDRFGAVAHARASMWACGALDMVNFGGMETVPERYQGRLFYPHNPQVTLMRTTPAENARQGEWIASRLNRCDGPVRFLIPEGGCRRWTRRARPSGIRRPTPRCSPRWKRTWCRPPTAAWCGCPATSTTRCSPARRSSSTLKSPNTEDRRHAAL